MGKGAMCRGVVGMGEMHSGATGKEVSSWCEGWVGGIQAPSSCHTPTHPSHPNHTTPPPYIPPSPSHPLPIPHSLTHALGEGGMCGGGSDVEGRKGCQGDGEGRDMVGCHMGCVQPQLWWGRRDM